MSLLSLEHAYSCECKHHNVNKKDWRHISDCPVWKCLQPSVSVFMYQTEFLSRWEELSILFHLPYCLALSVPWNVNNWVGSVSMERHPIYRTFVWVIDKKGNRWYSFLI